MKKRKLGRKLGRKRDQRRALKKQLACSLIMEEKITTTEAKAKELRGFVEKLITKAKKQNLASKRELSGRLSSAAAQKLTKELGLRYKDRPGGYTRVLKLGPRKSDGAKMAIIELI